MASVFDSEKCAKVLGQGFQFGVDAAGIAAQLRAIADEIESGGVLVQKATAYHSLSIENFAITGVVLQFSERIECRRSQKLYGSESAFPVAVVNQTNG